METLNKLLIAIDAGHGGYDNGASYNGRLEKDDNLRLAREVQKQLLAQGLNVLMTRSDDVFVSLQDRAQMANDADADLFVSLHRNSYIEQTPDSNGVENIIYLTAPEHTTGVAAQKVLDQVVYVGVQNNRGVRRGNYYVLRRTIMPAMLLEMGYIINDTDNRLFDEYLIQYAIAITKGIMDYFGVPFDPSRAVYTGAAAQPAYDMRRPPVINMPVTGETPPAVNIPATGEMPTVMNMTAHADNAAAAPQARGLITPGCGVSGMRVMAAQQALNDLYASNLIVSGFYDCVTRAAIVAVLQRELNNHYNTGLMLTGDMDEATIAALRSITPESPEEMVLTLQIMLLLNAYDCGMADGRYGPRTRSAVQVFQRDFYLEPNGIVSAEMIRQLLNC